MAARTYGWAIWSDFKVEGQETSYRLKVGKMIKYSNIPSRPKSGKTDKHETADGQVVDPMSQDGQVFDPLCK